MNKLIAFLLSITFTCCVPSTSDLKQTHDKIEWNDTQARKEWKVILKKHTDMISDSIPGKVIRESLLKDLKIWCDKWDMPYEAFAKQLEK